jgi:hypothetical protein
MGGDDELGAAPPLPDAPSIVHNTGAIPLARVPEAGDGEDDELSQFGQNIGPGSLCLIQGPGVGERFARYVNGGVFTVIEDDDDPDVVMRAVAQEEPGGTYVVRLEDPSRCLGWVLRRLEEGARVMVETRARTIEGARRTLLGVSASPRAETWLEAHALHWLTRRAGIWTLESGSRR